MKGRRIKGPSKDGSVSDGEVSCRRVEFHRAKSSAVGHSLGNVIVLRWVVMFVRKHGWIFLPSQRVSWDTK